jgi:ectoine hydroxylase-related dioxygenase (phytanoyl-CoA dioxygenase family)
MTNATVHDSPSSEAYDCKYSLPEGAARRYREDGFIVLSQLASRHEIATVRPAITKVARNKNEERRPLEQRDTYGKAFLQTMNLHEHDDHVKAFVMARRFARVAAELMGVGRVRLYHDQALFKEPHGGHTPWHQDHYYWPLDTAHATTMWMPLVDLDEAMGIMHFARGSQRHGALAGLPIGDASDEELSRYIAESGFEICGPKSLRAGDATFHSGWTLHGAPPNRSPREREVMTVIYYADGARVTEPESSHQQYDLYCWLPGLSPGDPAASLKNPLLYSVAES